MCAIGSVPLMIAATSVTPNFLRRNWTTAVSCTAPTLSAVAPVASTGTSLSPALSSDSRDGMSRVLPSNPLPCAILFAMTGSSAAMPHFTSVDFASICWLKYFVNS